MRRAVFIVLVVVLLVLGVQRCSQIRDLTRRGPEKFTLAEGPKLNLQDVQVLSALDTEYTKLVDSVMPSVVAITTLSRVRVPQAMDPFDYYYGRRGRTAQQVRSGLGSGVIVSKEGHILTNHHVIEGVDEIRVQLNDGRIEPAELIGSDERVDIAVLRIKASNIAPLPFGDSENLRVGQMVFAVGNPFGLQETVTQGIISAKGRAISDTGPELLQTDAAVNPGNSGGPLLNLRGEIIGINSAIYSRTGSWAGISFAIPSGTARQTMERILQKRPPSQSYLGVIMDDLDPRIAQELGLPDTRGVLVRDVIEGSPAEKAGLQSGDVIVRLNNRNISSTRDIRRMVMDLQVGSTLDLVVNREGKEVSLKAQLAAMPEDLSGARIPQGPIPGGRGPSGQNFSPPSRNRGPVPGTQPQSQAPQLASGNVLSGISVGEIPERLRVNLPQNVRGGVVVTDLEPDAPATQQLQVGDVIEEVNQQPVRSVEDFYKAATSLPDRAERALLFVCRGKTRSFVVIAP